MMFGAKSLGAGCVIDGGVKKRSRRKTHPMTKSTLGSTLRYRPILSASSSGLATPLPSPMYSHASRMLSRPYPLKNPPPTSWFSGWCVLKRKGSPVCSALNFPLGEGSQKFASVRCGRSRRYPAQALSVTPTTARMGRT